MSTVLLGNAVATPILARGRGLGKLIQGLMDGDPVAWTITGVVVAIFIGIAVFKAVRGSGDE